MVSSSLFMPSYIAWHDHKNHSHKTRAQHNDLLLNRAKTSPKNIMPNDSISLGVPLAELKVLLQTTADSSN